MMATSDKSGPIHYVSGDALRAVLGVFPTGVAVVVTMDKQGRRIGVTANSFTSVSLDPPLILWCLRNRSSAFEAFCENYRFAISILADDQADISKHFAMPIRDKFTSHEFEDGLDGVPLISGAAGWLECVKESQHSGGDHTIFIGKVVRCSVSGKLPLLFCGGAYLLSSAAFSSQHELSYAPINRAKAEPIRGATDGIVGIIMMPIRPPPGCALPLRFGPSIEGHNIFHPECRKQYSAFCIPSQLPRMEPDP